MLVLHANWSDHALHVWAESLPAFLSRPAARGAVAGAEASSHPFALAAADLADALARTSLLDSTSSGQPDELSLRLPCGSSGPCPSDRLGGALGLAEAGEALTLRPVTVPTIRLGADHALGAMLQLEDRGPIGAVDYGHSVRYWASVARFVVEILADQRFVPTLYRVPGDGLRAAWQPWCRDEAGRARLVALIDAMPPLVRAVVDEQDSQAWPILDEALRALTDATVRQSLVEESFAEALQDHDGHSDANVRWLGGLLGPVPQVPSLDGGDAEILSGTSRWISRLDESSRARPFRLCLRLHEPDTSGPTARGEATPGPTWTVSLHLQSVDDPEWIIDAEQIWAKGGAGQFVGVRGLEHPHATLLSELGRLSQLYPAIEPALQQMNPTTLELGTSEACELVREYRPLLEESGFAVIVPAWWDDPMNRIGARLLIESPPLAGQTATDQTPGTGDGDGALGLEMLVTYRWQIAVGDQPLTEEEFKALAEGTEPLVRLRDRWVEVRPEELAEAAELLERGPEGPVTVLAAMRVAQDGRPAAVRLPGTGVDATGWVQRLLEEPPDDRGMVVRDQPSGFQGTLRPYQLEGLRWLAFLDDLSLGGCLADDMGLGKTIQLIALLLHERERRGAGAALDPTLLIVPTSLVANWSRELHRFAPNLSVHVHHGPDRLLDDRFAAVVATRDVVITTYALVSRDESVLGSVAWRRVVLDEAQYIKNPPTKQTTAIRSLRTNRRIALTGTPVENRLSELWSIMEFCNPGYLGSAGEFRRRFSVPIERHRDRTQAERLRELVRPFILRRVKTDPTVINDLPACVETREFATLSAEQAVLYQNVVNEMLSRVSHAEGIQRRGYVLSSLVKLKQVCDHPALLQRGAPAGGPASSRATGDGGAESLPPPASRSGKCRRLLEMLEEILSTGDRALVFTQFRQMGHLLAAMIQHDLDCQTLFLHGGTPQPKRQQMIDRFQAPDGPPVFVLSLKAGGVGINLTAANHVFHFDRWWNPAVENQATDRAFRIGQTRTVQVHTFVCLGTLEERIDQMIERKTELAQHIIGSGEQGLTDLTTGQLRELLTLRDSAMEIES